MKDYRGFLIRNERKRLNISLEALSHGICSPSYLSKIENNTLIANDSIYDLLLEKLGMQLLDKVEEEKLRSMLDLFFKYYMSSNQQLLKIMKHYWNIKIRFLHRLCLFNINYFCCMLRK